MKLRFEMLLDHEKFNNFGPTFADESSFYADRMTAKLLKCDLE